MKIAVILSRFPYPLEKGDKLRAYQHLKALSANYEVSLFCLSDEKPSDKGLEIIGGIVKNIKVYRLNKITILINLLMSFIRNLPLQVGYFFNRSIQRKMVSDIEASGVDIVYCQLIRTALYGCQFTCKKVIDFQDAFSVGTEQRMNRSKWVLKWLFKRELKLVKQFESNIFKEFEHHLVISERDREGICHDQKLQITVMPNGIDTDFFKNDKTKGTSSTILFVGNMNYTPNIDAAVFLINEIMPLVWKKNKSLNVTIAGANPSSAVQELSSPRVTITGWVDDIRVEYAKAEVFVAPMRIGTGVQNKLMEAMAMGIPSITTTISAQPLGVRNGEELLIANTASELSDAILKLINDEILYSRVSGSGRSFIEERYSNKKADKKFAAFFEKIVE